MDGSVYGNNAYWAVPGKSNICCNNYAGPFSIPPFLLKQSCDRDPSCHGFVFDVTTESQGRLCKFDLGDCAGNCTSYIKMPTSQQPRA